MQTKNTGGLFEKCSGKTLFTRGQQRLFDVDFEQKMHTRTANGPPFFSFMKQSLAGDRLKQHDHKIT